MTNKHIHTKIMNSVLHSASYVTPRVGYEPRNLPVRLLMLSRTPAAALPDERGVVARGAGVEDGGALLLRCRLGCLLLPPLLLPLVSCCLCDRLCFLC